MREVRTRTLRQEHTEHTRRALIDAAARMFAERGYAATSIDDVAGAARVTRGALYHHFPGKQAIFNAVCEAVDAAVVDRVRAAGRSTGSAEQRLRRVLDAYFEASRDPAYRAIVLGEAHKTQAFAESERYTPAMTDAIDDFVRSLAQEGEIVPENPEMLRRLLCAILYEVAATTDDPAYSPAAEEYAKRVICGLIFTDRRN
ncbi:MAG TPA: TetR family transcriptional regulator [Actinoplanes sp.]|jgi:AcrR family transcriptional regulator